jgi:hypothetical protein
MVRIIGGVIAASVAVALVLPVFAANPLSGNDIKAEFGTGATIKGTMIPGGAAYELNLAPDGMARMRLAKGDRTVRTGSWRVSAAGYCATWSAEERCYALVANGKAFDLVGATGKVVARWTK